MQKTKPTSSQTWWQMGLFSHSNEEASFMSKITKKEFYHLFAVAILEDLDCVWSALLTQINQIIERFQPFLENQNVFVFTVTAFLIILSCYVYFKVYKLPSNNHTKQARKCGPSRKDAKLDGQYSENRKNDGENVQCSHSHCRTPYWKVLTGILFLCFLLSIPWEFVRVYQSMVAEKVTQMTIGIPAECVPERMSLLQTLQSWLRWHLSWSQDPCLQYHKSLLIDPLWQVPPLLVISSVLSHCIVHPVEVILGGLGRSFRLFFSEIPGPWQPVMLFVIVIFALLIVTMCFGYRIHLPFLLKIEPRTPVFLKVKGKKRPVEVHDKKRTLDLSIESSQDVETQSSVDTCGSLDFQWTCTQGSQSQ
ncbi:uncharacterized protein LOC127838680 isoform X2 [Dreissena polymorpha]|uniref:Chloride channel CLIC-like protein 1 n=2 Tax=Dreissena polymorpha TaxID=45954 RepID=A0A9D4FGV5_DREPO|nr:uncharacterized protein LOC127838680 isoform X2 [Dreissena polymorpha]KAH3798849.1 hypothetical protein DPMN_152452 [Dreissena polymorpha]